MKASQYPLACLIASQYRPRELEYDDAVQESYLGIMRAKRTFDPSKGKWSVYARRWAVHFMQLASGCRKKSRAKHAGILVPLEWADEVPTGVDVESQLDARRALRGVLTRSVARYVD